MLTCNLSELYTRSHSCYVQMDDLENELISCNDTLDLQHRLSRPIPWIGLYVAAASLVCLLALAADTFQGFCRKTFWIPFKFFTLNAATLTLLAAVMKLPLDLGTSGTSITDQMAKVSSMTFMCVIMANFMLSLGAMSDKEILLNLVALIILVINMLVNVGIQLGTGAIADFTVTNILTVPAMISMFLLVVILSVTAFALPTFRNILELKYCQIHKAASREDFEQNGMVKAAKLKENVTKYWIMTKTGNPQFYITRFATYYASSAICFLLALLFVSNLVMACLFGHLFNDFSSDYKWSTLTILFIQSIGVIVGTIAPVSRWLTATVSNCSKNRRNINRDEFKVENYWLEKLLHWKWIPLQIQNQNFRKLVQTTKILVLDLCIGLQKVTVVASKAVRYTSIILVSLILSSCRKKMFQTRSLGHSRISEVDDIRRYVLQLEGEEELSEKTLKDISRSLDDLILIAKRQRPRNLAQLLKKCTSIEGMAKFNCNEHPNSSSLVVVTLASIAIVLPNIDKDVCDKLLHSVSEGLIYIRQIEESLDAEGLLVDTRRSVDYVWLMVELYRKWLDEDLQELPLKGKSSKENLEFLAGVAAKYISNLERGANGALRVIAANSMHRICQIMLLDFLEDVGVTDEILFDKISITIADIIASCLTNLPRLIIRKCHSSSIENRELSVSMAAHLLGETEEILEILQQLEHSNINVDQEARNDSPVGSVESFSGSSTELDIAIN